MDKKKIWLVLRIIVLLIFMGVTAYIYLNKDRSEPVSTPEANAASIRRCYLDGGLSVEGPTDYTERLSAECYDRQSDVTRAALKAAGIESGILDAAVYEMDYNADADSVSGAELSGENPGLMCSVSLKGTMADEEGDLKIFRIDGNNAARQQMFRKEKDPSWISEGAAKYLLVRLYPEELLIAEADEQEEQEVQEEEPAPTEAPTPTAKPKATPTPTPRVIAVSANTVYVSTADVNVRKSPGKDGAVLGVAKKGTELKGLEATEDPEWMKIEYKDGVGYVNSQFVGEQN